MQTRKIGSSGLQSSAMGFGCMGMSEFYGETDDAQSLKTLEHAHAKGVTLFDTADAYGFGHNEELLGRFLKGKRNCIVVATKFGLVRKPGSYERRVDNSPAYIRSACDASLKRLGVDKIDVYYIHRLNLETPLEDSIGTLGDLVKAGKIRTIGLSEVSPDTLGKAAALHPIPGTKRITYLDDNLGALAVSLTPDVLNQINEALPMGAAAGERYTTEGMKGLAV